MGFWHALTSSSAAPTPGTRANFFIVYRMRKISRDLENPIDDVLIELANKLSPLLLATGHSPNLITTYSFASALFALGALWQNEIGGFVLGWSLQYFWDCVDGHFARKYRMESKLGDAYDHITDVLTTCGLGYIVIRKYQPPLWAYGIVGVLIVLLMVHAGCQQRNTHTKTHKESMDLFQASCASPSWIHWTRFFGFGTFQVAIIILIVYLHYTRGT